MFSLSLLSLVLAAAQPTWQTDYDRATRQAMKEKKDLVIYFRGDDRLDQVIRDPEVQERLSRFVCLQLPADYSYQGQRLLDHSALADMLGRPGLVVVSYHDDQLPFYQEAVSVHPFVRSHYHWVPEYGVNAVCTILDMPPEGTLSQRSMIYAVSVHPERPRSILARLNKSFLDHAQRHSQRQARMQNQHHADIIAASHRFQESVGQYLMASEVVAESWGNVVGGENVLEAAFSCVDAWRHSSGHWGAVSRDHAYYGYDIARGANGTWYATGIFAD
jgi:hypothetical protein